MFFNTKKNNHSNDFENKTEKLEDIVLNKVRSEYSPLARFLYHYPLDWEKTTLPPKFEAAVHVDYERLPLPPITERHGHCGSDREYLDWGLHDYQVIVKYILNYFPSFKNLNIMDFGCSSGRILRHFYENIENDGFTLTGCDASAIKIEWLRQNFPREFCVFTGGLYPSIPFESNTFDVIYGMSVFTHIKYLWDSWLLELKRVLKPGGIIIQSIHTEDAYNFFQKNIDEQWVKEALGDLRIYLIENPKMTQNYILHGDIDKNEIFIKKETLLEYWGRYYKKIKIYPLEKKYSYQNWVVAQKV